MVLGWEWSCAEPGCCGLGPWPDPEHMQVTSQPAALLRPTCFFQSVSGGTSSSETAGTIQAGLVSGKRKESGSASYQFLAVKIATWLGTFYTHTQKCGLWGKTLALFGLHPAHLCRDAWQKLPPEAVFQFGNLVRTYLKIQMWERTGMLFSSRAPA